MRQRLPQAPFSSPAASRRPLPAEILIGCLEALFFASERPLSRADLLDLLADQDGLLLSEQIDVAIRELQAFYNRPHRGIHLIEVAGGWQFRTQAVHAPLIHRLFENRPPKLSQAALEVCSIVAYRQPITRSQIDAVRGVDSSGVLRALLDRKILRVVGKAQAPGSPSLYGTSPEFLELFGLTDLTQLPALAQLDPDVASSIPPSLPVLPEKTETR